MTRTVYTQHTGRYKRPTAEFTCEKGNLYRKLNPFFFSCKAYLWEIKQSKPLSMVLLVADFHFCDISAVNFRP